MAVEIATVNLENPQSLHERTPMSAQDIVELLEFCRGSTKFLLGQRYYKQFQGTVMGSPVLIIVAYLVMDELENDALSTFAQRPRLYDRFF